MKKAVIGTVLAMSLTPMTLMAGNGVKGDIEAGKAAYSTCIGCHGIAAEGGVGPVLAGKDVSDIASKLVAYQKGEQVGPLTSMMAPMAAGLSEGDIANLAAYLNQI